MDENMEPRASTPENLLTNVSDNIIVQSNFADLSKIHQSSDSGVTSVDTSYNQSSLVTDNSINKTPKATATKKVNTCQAALKK